MRALLWSIAKRLLFRIDAEAAHRLTMAMLRLGIRLGGWPLRLASGAPRVSLPAPAEASGIALPTGAARVLGMDFLSRVGLAAGFDKDAEIVEGLPALGFGFAEIGTVTPRPQPGNERPRLFRDPARQAVFNRMGFNGLGATLVSERLRRARPHLPQGFRIGVNLGKNKDTPLEDAASDYVRAARAFEGLADYLVINVSSPNTPGLRSLQSAEALKPIVNGVAALIAGWKPRPPLLLKLAPEIRGDDLGELLRALESWGIDGFVLTNTLGGTWPPEGARTGAPAPLSGGYSGAPLVTRARESLIEARAATKLPIVSVGGILSPEEAAERIRLGADLVQLYAGWIFHGPAFPVRVSRKLAHLASR